MQIFEVYLDPKKITEFIKNKKLSTTRIDATTYGYRIKFLDYEKIKFGTILKFEITKFSSNITIEKTICHAMVQQEDKHVIVMGKGEYRNLTIKAIVQMTEHSSLTNPYNEIILDKEKANEVFGKLKKYNKDNYILNPRFEFDSDGYGEDKLGLDSFTIVQNRCASRKSDYNKMFKAATYMPPIFGIYASPGIQEQVLQKNPIKLKLSKNWTFSQFRESSDVEWLRFYFQICHSV